MKAIVITAALALVLAPVAGARGIDAVEVCGSGGCGLVPLPQAEPHAFPGDDGRQVSVPPAAPFLELRLHGGGDVERLWYVPSQRLVAVPRGTSVEFRPLTDGALDRAIARTAASVPPFARPRVVEARVDGKRLEGAAAAVDAVFDDVPSAKAHAWDDRSVRVTTAWSRGNPWERAEVRWIPGTRLWQRGDDVKVLPPQARAPALVWAVPAGLTAALLALAGLGRARERRPGRLHLRGWSGSSPPSSSSTSSSPAGS